VKKSLEKFYLHVRPPFFYPIREGIVREDTGAGVHREGWYRGGGIVHIPPENYIALALLL